MSGIETKRTLTEREILIEELRWKKFPCLDDGFVCMVDVLGSDDSVVRAARISHGQDHRPDSDGEEYTESKKRNLLRYMMRNNHGTPFEMCEVAFLIRIPMDAWRQFVRHRTLNINEYSTRYTEAIDRQQRTDAGEWRLQSGSNKQGSSGLLADSDEPMKWTLAKELTKQEEELHLHAWAVYQNRLEEGVAKEQARKDLPLSTYTEAYVKCDLRNWFHFLGLRLDSHAQKEIREYSQVIAEVAKQLFPLSYEAFSDYRLNGMFLSSLDQEVIKRLDIYHLENPRNVEEFQELIGEVFTNKREGQECLAKLKKLGLVE